MTRPALHTSPVMLWQDETGHSLIEALLATVLLGAVLLPLITTAFLILQRHQGEHLLLAQAEAQQVMEATLQTASYQAATLPLAHTGWYAERTLTHRPGYLVVEVAVYAPSRTTPITTLMTLRTLPHAD